MRDCERFQDDAQNGRGRREPSLNGRELRGRELNDRQMFHRALLRDLRIKIRTLINFFV